MHHQVIGSFSLMSCCVEWTSAIGNKGLLNSLTSNECFLEISERFTLGVQSVGIKHSTSIVTIKPRHITVKVFMFNEYSHAAHIA